MKITLLAFMHSSVCLLLPFNVGIIPFLLCVFVDSPVIASSSVNRRAQVKYQGCINLTTFSILSKPFIIFFQFVVLVTEIPLLFFDKLLF